MPQDMHLLSLLLMGLGLGVLHALDADHIAAVAGLGARRPAVRDCMRFSLHWGLGHAGLLLLLAVLAYGLDMRLPERFAAVLDVVVAALLIGIGVSVLLGMHRKRLRLSLHRHPGGYLHLHWRSDATGLQRMHTHDHRAVLIGMLHGAAGSGPVLALLPTLLRDSLIWSVAFIGVFALTVACTMFAFGGALGIGFERLALTGTVWVQRLQGTVGALSIGIGTWMLLAR